MASGNKRRVPDGYVVERIRNSQARGKVRTIENVSWVTRVLDGGPHGAVSAVNLAMVWRCGLGAEDVLKLRHLSSAASSFSWNEMTAQLAVGDYASSNCTHIPKQNVRADVLTQ